MHLIPDRARLRQLVGWTVVGVAAAVVEFGLLRALTVWLGVALVFASALAAETMILAKFAATDRWVFGHGRPAFGRLWRYHGACAGALVAYWLTINGTATFLGAPDWLAFILGTGASFLWSLASNFLWVWAQPSPPLALSLPDQDGPTV